MTPVFSLNPTWSGSFIDLVAKANQLWSRLSPKSEPITERSARHYQQTGVLGRGVRHGRSSLFFARDVAALVSAKSLAHERWPLEQVQKLLSIDMSTLSNAAIPSASSADPAVFMVKSSPAVFNSPVSLVDRLMAQAQSAPSTPTLSTSLSPPPPLLTRSPGQSSAVPSRGEYLRSTLASITNTSPHTTEESSSNDLSGVALTLNSLYRQNLSDGTASSSGVPDLPSLYPAHVIDLDPQLQILQRSTAPRDRRRHAALLRRLADQWDPPKN